MMGMGHNQGLWLVQLFAAKETKKLKNNITGNDLGLIKWYRVST